MVPVLVSVIMPVYNSEKYLNESIQSVILQTFRNWELLIIDDCSTDNSSIIIQQYVDCDSRIKRYKTSKPSGSPAAPRNVGIRSAIGRYIAFLDSDDVWLPTKLERQLCMFEEYEDMVICFSNYEKINEYGERRNRFILAPANITYDQLLYSNVIGCLTAVYDTSKVGKIYFKQHHHEDYILWLSILKKGYLARNTNTIEALYRVRGNSVSSNKFRVISWQWDIYRNVEHLGILCAISHFLVYAYKAIKKVLI